MKKHWVHPDCQNSEPTKRTVSIWANIRVSRIWKILDFQSNDQKRL